MRISEFSYYVDNIEYHYIKLLNKNNMEITLSSCGAGIREIKLPNKNGEIKTITLAPIDNKLYNQAYHGKIIGRTSGRIENASFAIDGRCAYLEKNNQGIDNLHGGSTGFHVQNFDYVIEANSNFTDIIFLYLSPNGEGGYFGNIDIKITYRIYKLNNKFEIIINGISDCKNYLNITNHVYWNLSGDLCDNILNHELFINASKRGFLNERSILTEILPVSKEFDFRKPKLIGEDINADCVTLNTIGYDHPFYLDEGNVASTLYCKESGIKLSIKTTYPVVVCYVNNYPEYDKLVFNDKYDDMNMAVCLECQYSPNGLVMTPNNAGVFEKEYNHKIEYEFEELA